MSNQMHPKIHSVMIFLVYFLFPLAIISVYYYHIARTLVRSAHDMPGEVSEHSRRQVTCIAHSLTLAHTHTLTHSHHPGEWFKQEVTITAANKDTHTRSRQTGVGGVKSLLSVDQVQTLEVRGRSQEAEEDLQFTSQNVSCQINGSSFSPHV